MRNGKDLLVSYLSGKSLMLGKYGKVLERISMCERRSWTEGLL
ncbi:hypothetical protein N9232_00900 [Akkermansiaceae bacterium]|nr:hypothetical protein [Akkermansiaceae bacterium]